jgi:hypothetical protein
LYGSVPEVVGADSLFYELLCLVDSLRVGKVREQELAAVELKKRLAKIEGWCHQVQPGKVL